MEGRDRLDQVLNLSPRCLTASPISKGASPDMGTRLSELKLYRDIETHRVRVTAYLFRICCGC